MAETVGNLAYKLTVDNGQFTSGMTQAGQQINTLSQQAKGGGSAIEQAFAGIGGSATKALDSFKSGGISGGIASLIGDVQGLGGSLAGIAGPWGVAAAGIAAGFTLIISAAGEASAKVNEINRLSKSLNESSENTQVLQRVFQNAGVEAEQSSTILLRFFDRIGDLRRSLREGQGGGETGKALRSLGLDPEAISRANPEAAIEQIVTALAQLPNAYDRASASQALFGRAFADIEPIVRRGAAAFQDARTQVANIGVGQQVLRLAEDTAAIDRNLRRFEGGTPWERIKRGWDDTLTGIANSWARFRLGVSEFNIDALNALGVTGDARRDELIRELRGQSATPSVQLSSLDRAGDAARERTRKADEAAGKLLETWRNTADTIGLSARQAAIVKAEQDGASEATLRELRARDAVLSRLERQAEICKEIQGVLNSSNAAIATFQIGLNRANEVIGLRDGITSTAGQTAVIAGLFRTLERSIGLGGRESFANTGVTAGSIEEAKIIADLQTRQNNGNDIQSRVLQVLEAARAIAEAQLEESRAIADALRNRPQLGIAPVRD